MWGSPVGWSGAGAWGPLGHNRRRGKPRQTGLWPQGLWAGTPAPAHAPPPQCVVIGLQSTGEARTREVLDEKDGQLDCFVSAAE